MVEDFAFSLSLLRPLSASLSLFSALLPFSFSDLGVLLLDLTFELPLVLRHFLFEDERKMLE